MIVSFFVTKVKLKKKEFLNQRSRWCSGELGLFPLYTAVCDFLHRAAQWLFPLTLRNYVRPRSLYTDSK